MKSVNKLKKKSNCSKRKILNFYKKYGRLPHKDSDDIYESKLGYRLNNYCSEKNGCFDKEFKDKLISECGRKNTPKACHDPEKIKSELISFIKKNKRPPSRKFEGEAEMYGKYAYYMSITQKHIDPDIEFINKVRSIDKCSGTTIPYKYRRDINEALNHDIIDERELLDICK